MHTTHQIFFSPAQSMEELEDESIQLTVTSPPYPMIEMWDDIFSQQDLSITKALGENDGNKAFELMNLQLDRIWEELYRVTMPGGIVCINIGDATRTLNGEFRLYSNHARIINSFLKLGFSNLPNILWRKQTNAPNKFMGSGMLPPGAYVTLEHEYILIFRKGNKRPFNKTESQTRAESAFFWEERNQWFSDVWNVKGTRQQLQNPKARERSGAFPFELAYRLINMFSIKGDNVLDPFLGTGTTSLAALAAARDSIGYEIDKNLGETIQEAIGDQLVDLLNDKLRRRILDHLEFVKNRKAEKGEEAFKYVNKNYDFPVMTRQEREILLNYLDSIESLGPGNIKATYHREPLLDKFSNNSLFAVS